MQVRNNRLSSFWSQQSFEMSKSTTHKTIMKINVDIEIIVITIQYHGRKGIDGRGYDQFHAHVNYVEEKVDQRDGRQILKE